MALEDIGTEFGFTASPADADLRSRLGLQEGEDIQIHVFRRPEGRRGSMEFVTSMMISEFQGPQDLAAFGPGTYLLRPYKDGRYRPGSVSFTISEEAAKEAGWKRNDQSAVAAQTGPVLISPEYEILKGEINALREQLSAVTASRDSIIASAIAALAQKNEPPPPPPPQNNGVLELIAAMNQKSDERFQAMMAIQQSIAQSMAQAQQSAMQAYAEMMATVMRENASQNRAVLEAIIAAQQSRKEPSITELVAVLAPLISKTSPEDIAKVLISTFRDGLQTAAAISGGGEESILQTILKYVAPTIGPAVLGALLNRGQAQQPPPPPPPPPPPASPEPRTQPQVQAPTHEHQLPAGTTSPSKAESGTPQTGQAEQGQQTQGGGQDEYLTVLMRATRGEVDAMKRIFYDYAVTALRVTGNPIPAYEMLSQILPAGIHEKIPEVGPVKFDDIDPQMAPLMETFWQEIIKEYSEEGEAEEGG